MKKCATDHLGRARPIRPGQYPALPSEVTGLSLVAFDSNEALAIRRNDDAADSAQFGGLDGRLPDSAIARQARDRAIGQANREAGAIG